MREKVIAVSVVRTKDDARLAQESIEELHRLIETAGGQVVSTLTQNKANPDPATFIGKGKTQELKDLALSLGVHTIVFDDELKPVQQRNLEEATDTKVVDRTRLILDIFAQRARTREGKLQVELAQLTYLLPRMTERFGVFEQQVGGIGTRGPGERKLEVDRRRVRDRIAKLKGQIEGIRDERQLQRSVRRSIPMPQVAVVGYTNAGKSTVLNALLDRSGSGQRQVYADDLLFATLDPTTRRIRLPSGYTVLFTDTVGFIRKLPTELIAAFRATLEEATNAELILHVVDASDPAWEDQEQSVLRILESLDMDKLPRITAYNKMDRLSQKQRDSFARLGGVCFSAKTGQDLDQLLKAVEERLAKQWVEHDFLFGYNEGGQLAQLHEHVEILSQKTTDRGILVRVRSHPATLAHWLDKRKKP